MVFNSAITSWFDGFKTLPAEEKDNKDKINFKENGDIITQKIISCEVKQNEYEKQLKRLNKNLEKKEKQNIKLKLKLEALKVDLKFSKEEMRETQKQLKKNR